LILVDSNLCCYAHVGSFAPHEVAREWLDRQLSGVPRVGLPWASLLGFLRIVTNPRLFDRPEPMAAAWEQVREWLAWVPEPTAHHAELLGALLALPGVHGGLVPDAHLAALAMEHGLILCSADGDFARFPGLRRMNPIAA